MRFKRLKAGDRQLSAKGINEVIDAVEQYVDFQVAPPLMFNDGGSGRILTIEGYEELAFAVATDYHGQFPDHSDTAEKDRKQFPFCIVGTPWFDEGDKEKTVSYDRDWAASKGDEVKAINLFKDQWPVPGDQYLLGKIAEQWYFYYQPQRKRVKIKGGNGSPFNVYDCLRIGSQDKNLGDYYPAYLSDCQLATGGSIDYQPGTIAYVRWDPYYQGVDFTAITQQSQKGAWVFCETLRWARIINFQWSTSVIAGDNDNNPSLNRWFDGCDPRKNEDPANPGGGTNGFYVQATGQNNQGDVGWAVLDSQVDASTVFQKLRYIEMFTDCPVTP